MTDGGGVEGNRAPFGEPPTPWLSQQAFDPERLNGYFRLANQLKETQAPKRPAGAGDNFGVRVGFVHDHPQPGGASESGVT